MLTDYELANLCQSQYDGVQGVFDHDFTNEQGDRYCIKYYDDCSVVAHEGSHDFLNWFNNARFVMEENPVLGGVDIGFDIGVGPQTAQATPLLPKDKVVYVIGHSRAGPRAYLMAARLIKLGYQVIIVTFASPRPGDSKLAAIINTAKEVRSYRNYHDFDQQDFVCDVPLPHPFGYVHPVQPIIIDAPPSPGDSWGILARHHLFLYTQALKGIVNG